MLCASLMASNKWPVLSGLPRLRECAEMTLMRLQIKMLLTTTMGSFYDSSGNRVESAHKSITTE